MRKDFSLEMTSTQRPHEFDRLLNCDMNRPYKMPGVVGGKGAQREEVFPIINLSPQSRVLCSGKQLWQQPVLNLPNITTPYLLLLFTNVRV